MHRYENEILDTRSHDLMDFSIFFFIDISYLKEIIEM
jgi:hypothetical protein